MSSFSFNSIYILESLSEVESEMTCNLYSIIENQCKGTSIETGYQKIYDRLHLIKVLNHINELAKNNGVVPILHLAIHGNEKGLVLIEGTITWEELTPYLSELNYITKCNLVITLAVCYGAFIIELLGLNVGRAPFHAIFGPTVLINANLIDSFFQKFYSSLLSTFDINSAVQVAASCAERELPIVIPTANEFIVNALNDFVDDIKSGKKRHSIIRGYMDKHNIPMPYEIKQKIQYPNDLLNELKPTIASVLENYLMTDIYPENRIRFDVDRTLIHLFS